MEALLSFGAAGVFPLAIFGLLVWLSRLEDSIPRAVQRARRTPDPAPILRVPVRAHRPEVSAVVAAEPAQPLPGPSLPEVPVPGQRGPGQPAPVRAHTSEVSRSGAVSLGGSTNR